jgi:hypothetical protein
MDGKIPSQPFSKRPWFGPAVYFGTCMFFAITVFPFIRKGYGSGHWDWIELLIGAVACSFGGFIYGWLRSKGLGK